MADLAALSELPAPPPPVLLPTPGALAPPVMVPEAAPELDPMLLLDQPALDAQLQPPVLLPSPPMSDIQAAEAEVVGGARDIERATGQIDRLQTRGAELAGTALASTDPEERAALGDRIGAIGEAGKRIDQERAATRAAVEQSALELQGQAEVAAAEATAAAARERAQQSAELSEQFAGREAERAERQVVAREQFAKDREEASRAMRAEPSGASWQSVIEVVGETMRAERAGEVPRYGEIVARAMNAGRQRHKDKVAASVDQMNLSLDSVQRISLEQSELRAVESAERAAIFDAVEERLTAEMATIQEPLARAQAAQRIDQVRQQRAQAEAAAVQARDESELKRRKARADVGLVEAKTATELAKAAKLGRRGGSGRAAAPSAGLVAANVVPIPGTDTPLVTFSDDARGRAEAKATRDIVGEQQSFLETMNGVEAFYEDAEKQGLLSSIGVRGSDANERLSAMLGVAAGKLAQIKAGPGKATTASDEEWAEQFLPENPKSWTNKARGMRRIKQATAVFEDESRSLLGRTTRLDTATRERVVKEARKRSVSQTQRARSLASRAAQTVGDRSKDSATRAKAVELIEENARAQAQEGGDWLELATAQTATALEGVEDTDVLAAGTKQLAKYRRLVDDREKALGAQYGQLKEERGAGNLPTGRSVEDPSFALRPEVKAARAVKAKIEKAGRAMAKRQLGVAGESISTMLGLDEE